MITKLPQDGFLMQGGKTCETCKEGYLKVATEMADGKFLYNCQDCGDFVFAKKPTKHDKSFLREYGIKI